ncbi:MAG TPA: fumarate hydratase [Thermoanaerobaculia bacterium]
MAKPKRPTPKPARKTPPSKKQKTAARHAAKQPARPKKAPKAAAKNGAKGAAMKAAPKRPADPFGEKALIQIFTELLRRAATSIPPDVLAALEKAREREAPGSVARDTFDVLIENTRLAKQDSLPICQDTGMPFFEVAIPRGISIGAIERAAVEATRQATKGGFLRPNSVDTLTNKNPGDGAGKGMPIVHVHEGKGKGLSVQLILKGGGSENVGTQSALPNVDLGADRDIDGVKKIVLEAIFNAQGKGCAPGVIGFCFGGDRANGYAEAKKQLFRRLDDTNPDPTIAAMEAELLEKGNLLGIGPMGYGGKTTLLGVKGSYLARLPACYFVSVTYMCWATRRAAVEVLPSGKAVYSQ